MGHLADSIDGTVRGVKNGAGMTFLVFRIMFAIPFLLIACVIFYFVSTLTNVQQEMQADTAKDKTHSASVAQAIEKAEYSRKWNDYGKKYDDFSRGSSSDQAINVNANEDDAENGYWAN
jgi:uncharacterized membrane protein